MKKTYSQKVIKAMEQKKLKKVDVYSKLEMSQPTFDTRLKDNNWRLQEMELLNSLLNISHV